jgi:phosphoribosylamine-glycine ligase
VLTAGGRVLTVVATAPTLPEARAKAYRNVQRIYFSRAHYRRDIAAPSQNARTE